LTYASHLPQFTTIRLEKNMYLYAPVKINIDKYG